MPRPVLATRLIRPLALMFSRSLGVMNTPPKDLYLFFMPVPDNDNNKYGKGKVHPTAGHEGPEGE